MDDSLHSSESLRRRFAVGSHQSVAFSGYVADLHTVDCREEGWESMTQSGGKCVPGKLGKDKSETMFIIYFSHSLNCRVLGH